MGAIVHELMYTNSKVIVQMINTSAIIIAAKIDRFLNRIRHISNKLAGSLMGESGRHGLKSFDESC